MTAGQVLGAVAAVVLLPILVWKRKSLSRERQVLGLLAVALLVAYAAGAFAHLPNPQKLIEDIAKGLGGWTYALVGVMAFLETGAFVGLVAPGEFTVIVGGVIAGQGTIEILPLIGLTWLCCVLGDTTSFFLGRRLGRPFMEKHGPRVGITPARLDQVEAFLRRHGGKSIVIGRFIGLVRAVAPFVVGSSGLPYRRFIPYSVVGTGLWASTYCLLGYFFYQSFHQVAAIAGQATLVFAVLVAVVLGIRLAYKRRKELRAWIESKPALRPVLVKVVDPTWRAIEPRARFLWNRLTPGDLGVEFTTALAVGGAGLFVFTGYTVHFTRDFKPTPGDNALHDLARDTYSSALKHVAEAITTLGTLPVTATVALVAAAFLAHRGRVTEAIVLVVGFALIVPAVDIAKAAVGRPRPPDPLVVAMKKAFPSGHAAYSTVYAAVAVSAARTLGGLTRRTAIVLVGIALAAAIGFTRIYLRVHWWSDVAGGWGLGAGIFGSVAAIALVVDYVRHNGGTNGGTD